MGPLFLKATSAGGKAATATAREMIEMMEAFILKDLMDCTDGKMNVSCDCLRGNEAACDD
jgi:hypothetical protein